MLDGLLGGGFNATKLKPQLKMACGRIQIASNKKSALLKQNMREVAKLLAEDPPKEEKARIRAEALIRDDHLIEAYEILQLECELLHERIKLLQYSKQCPHDLVSVVSTLIWASHRVDVPELLLIRKQFVAKYGKDFEENAMRNYDGCLNERVVSKLSVQPPAAYLVQTYLERICEQFEVDWTPSMKLTADAAIEPMAAPTGYSVPMAQGTGLGPVVQGFIPSPTSVDPNALPPVIPTAPSFPASTGTAATPKGSGIPPSVVNGMPMNKNNADLFDEPDIFIPGPKSSTTEQKKDSNDNDDDDDNTENVGGGGAGDGLSDSYANLAARFSQLQK